MTPEQKEQYEGILKRIIELESDIEAIGIDFSRIDGNTVGGIQKVTQGILDAKSGLGKAKSFISNQISDLPF